MAPLVAGNMVGSLLVMPNGELFNCLLFEFYFYDVRQILHHVIYSLPIAFEAIK